MLADALLRSEAGVDFEAIPGLGPSSDKGNSECRPPRPAAIMIVTLTEAVM